MQEKLSGYLAVLFEQNPQSVGGALPDSAYEHKAAAALARSGVSVSAVVTGERFLSIFVPREESDRALRIVHDALIAAE